MHTLDTVLRRGLENTICEARVSAEAAARIALEQLAVGEKAPYPHLTEHEQRLRTKLRLYGRTSGDDTTLSVDALVEEVAYQHWHRMLFTRFLAQNNLLFDDDPANPAPLSLKDCNDIASSLGIKTGWEVAARYASHILPQIFKIDSPVFSLTFPFEYQKALEKLVLAIPLEVFQASDSLGWVYQFWQTKRKNEITKSGMKIGARELPAVTQLFTEPYMVSFLLDNSLGAWWASRRLGEHELALAESEQELRKKASLPGMPLEYLRFVKDDQGKWTPIGGSFDAWPNDLPKFRMLDPCCGSGHFLVAMLGMLVPIRMEHEGLSVDEAIRRVLSENIHGLELDQRCAELAAFALAFAAWAYPGSKGYTPLPELHIACSGQAINIGDEKLRTLADGNQELFTVLADLKDKFEQAPILGSLIDPRSSDGQLFVDWNQVAPLLDSMLSTDEGKEGRIAAQGLGKAVLLLADSYHLVTTNVPYLARGKQDEVLRDYCEKHYSEAKGDLATVFLERCLQLCKEGGNTSIVSPQNWLFLSSYKNIRKKLLSKDSWHIVARLGEYGFDSLTAAGAFTALISLSRGEATGVDSCISCIDTSESRTIEQKAQALAVQVIKGISQNEQLNNPDARIAPVATGTMTLLSEYADSLVGIQTGDDPLFICSFWEVPEVDHEVWEFLQASPTKQDVYTGQRHIVRWERGQGTLHRCPSARATQGVKAVGKKGVAMHRMRNIVPYIFSKERFHQNIAVLIPKEETHFSAIWCFCSSPEYIQAVRQIDQKLNVTNATLGKVPFDLEHWEKVAEKHYPNGLPLPFTDDPTQWIFHGHPCGSVLWDEESKWTASAPFRSDSTVLQVAVARLLGYRWPAELDATMALSEEQRALVNKCGELLSYADNDGIVCIPSVGGESSASERLLKLLEASYGDAWTDASLPLLLENSGSVGKTLEIWLRDKFFSQHCKLFGNRPFIWQIWDGHPTGFSALVHYHKLDHRNLERLIDIYLGDWIQRQHSDVAKNLEGAKEKLSAAIALSKSLALILEGESPYDIFVRWKPLEEQPIGWNPDLHDGIRLNIRPFMSVPGKKGVGILRDKIPIRWGKDRGKDGPSTPWYSLGPLYGGEKGDKINDHHLSLDEKKKARRGEAKG